MLPRRDFLKQSASVSALARDAETVVVDPKPLFEISPYLYMQFMEPLGVADSSVEAAWDYDADDWRKDFVDTVRDLSPGVIRYGGLFSRYYKWREGVGPVAKRPWMRNYVWGGKETNRVGTHEFVDLCRRTGAEPLYCVNFLSDGETRYRTTREGDRTGDAIEAADWVSFANDVKLWQIGNETSYGTTAFSKDEAITRTIEFARAMKQRDRSIRLIGWGDRGSDGNLWARDMAERAGEHLDFVAIHMMGQRPQRADTVLKGLLYQKNPEQAWQELIELSNNVERRVSELEDALSGPCSKMDLAITEGHLSLTPGNANPILAEWLSAVYHARSLNIYQRHGARVKIATAADFQGSRWTVNAVMLQVPRGRTYLMPVGSIMRLFKRHNGDHGVAVKSAPSGLDIAASRAGSTIYLHVANLQYRGAVSATFTVDGMKILGAKAYAIAPDDVRQYVSQDQPDVFRPVETAIPAHPACSWRFPAGSVTAIELRCQ